MSVAAMTLDDQRPLMNSYDSKISKQYEQNLHMAPVSGPASPTPSGSEEPTTIATTTTATTAQQQFHHAHHQIAAQQQHHHHHHFHHRQTHATTTEHTQVLLQQQSPPSPIQQQQQTTTEAVAAVDQQRQRQLEDEIEQLKLEKTRLSQQCTDAQRREKILMRRLANKELEFQDYVSQIAEYKAAQAPTALALRTALLDPAVNLLFEKLKKELKATKAKLEETQNELSAWKFTPDSNTGKRLMAKCRLLYQENEELGKMTSNGRLAKLETELAMQKSFSEEVKKSQSELDDFLQELDEDVEGMQSTILFLQQELKTTRDRIQTLEKENLQYKNGSYSTEATSIMCKENLICEESTTILHPNAALLNGSRDAEPLIKNIIDYNETVQSTHAMIHTNNNANQLKFITPPMTAAINLTLPPLDTIEENVCLSNTQTRVTEFYGNGSSVEQQQPQQQQQLIVNNAIVLEESSGNSNSNSSSVPAKLRTAASRKRNYENELIENVAAITTTTTTTAAATSNVVVMSAAMTPTPLPTYSSTAAPRTLPPKKSKLRRTSVQALELNEHALQTQNLGMLNVSESSGNIVDLTTAASSGIVDNAVANTTNDEPALSGSGMLVDNTVEDGIVVDGVDGVAQRILLRRRSTLRTAAQQNGSGGGDSNH